METQPQYRASEAAHMLGIEKGTLVTAIRDGRLPAIKNERGHYLVTATDIQAFAERRERHYIERLRLETWISENIGNKPASISDDEWQFFILYAQNPTMTYTALAQMYGKSRQRWQQIIMKVKDAAGLIREDGTRGVP